VKAIATVLLSLCPDRMCVTDPPLAMAAGSHGCVTVLGVSWLRRAIRFLMVAALLRVPCVCSYLQSRDRKEALPGADSPQNGYAPGSYRE